MQSNRLSLYLRNRNFSWCLSFSFSTLRGRS